MAGLITPPRSPVSVHDREVRQINSMRARRGQGPLMVPQQSQTLPQYGAAHPQYAPPTAGMAQTLPHQMRQVPAGPIAQPVSYQQAYTDAATAHVTPPEPGPLQAGYGSPAHYQSMYRALGAPNPSAVQSYPNGYSAVGRYTVSPEVGQMENRAIDQHAQHGMLDSRWAMQYPQGQLQPRVGMSAPQTASMQEDRFTVGQRFGNATIQDVNGRKVVVGNNHRIGEVPQVRPRVGLDTGGQSYGRISPEEAQQRREAHIAMQDQKAGALAEGRRNRAIARNGLGLSPTYNFSQDPRTQQPGQFGPGPLGNNASLAQRQAALDNANNGQFSVASGFDFKTTGVDDAVDAYVQHSPNWSPADKQEFAKGIKTRFDADPAYRKAMTDRKDYPVRTDGTPYGTTIEQVNAENEIRKALGLPPLKRRVVEAPPADFTSTPTYGM